MFLVCYVFQGLQHEMLPKQVRGIMNLLVTVYCHDNVSRSSTEDAVERLLQNTSTISLSESLDATFDDVLHECAKRCNIPPLQLPLFGIRDKHSKHWIKLGTTLDSYSESRYVRENGDAEPLDNRRLSLEVEFRVRFTFKSECEIDGVEREARRLSLEPNTKFVMSDGVLQYLFYQQRESFLQEDVKISDRLSDQDGAALGAAVLDIIRISRELEEDINTVKQRVSLKRLLPRSRSKHYSSLRFWLRKRIKLKFHHYIQHFESKCARWLQSGCNVSFFYSRYLKNLGMVVDSLDAEFYQTQIHNDCTKLTVGSDCGIVKHSQKNEAGEKWCDFKDIADVRIQLKQNQEAGSAAAVTVTLTQLNGNLLTVLPKSVTEAEDLVSCIDGYYRLLVDAHHYLCKSVTAPSLLKHLSLKCHGPISPAYAEEILRNHPSPSKGECLLRQSPEAYGEYFINTITQVSPFIVKNYKLDRVGDYIGIYGDESSHCHSDLTSLLSACKEWSDNGHPVVPFNINKLVAPALKQRSNLMILRCSDESDLSTSEHGVNSSHPQIVPIMQRDYKFDRPLGNGRFTEVNLHALRSNSEQKIVIKQVYEANDDLGQKQHLNESFQESVLRFSCFRSVHIVQQIGLMRDMLVLEYVPLQSVTDYVKKTNREELSQEWYFHVIWQLALACSYLEDMNCPHGNIRGKNALLWHALPRPHIKLSDSGVRTCVRPTKHKSVIEPALVAPWLAYEFCNIDGIPAAHHPTINGDKWSFAVTVCEICDWRTACDHQNAYSLTPDMKQCYKNRQKEPMPEILSSPVVCDFRNLLIQCWDIIPYNRPSFKQILRELGLIISSDCDDLDGVVKNEGPSVSDTDLPDLEIYEDENLLFVHQLGRGHFGCVDLYRYDRFRNGHTELVAVKSLKVERKQGVREIYNEIQTMRRLNDRYIVKLKGVAEPSVRIVMEYLPNGSLAVFLRRKSDHNVPISTLYHTLLVFAAQISQGMLALQQNRLIHRDLALRNILLHRDSPNSPLYVKISDFGLSRILGADEDYYKSHPDEFPAQWYAPECLRLDEERLFRFESDVWSFGVTVWEMFSYGARPQYHALPRVTLNDLSQLYNILQRGHRLSRPTGCPASVYALIEKCWAFRPTDRIGFDELVREFGALSNEHNP